MKKKILGIPEEILLSIRELFETSSIQSLSSKNEEYSISISRKTYGIDQKTIPSSQSDAVSVAPVTKACSAPSDPYDSPDYIKIKSPITGTFYNTASPDSDPFVSIGQKISVGMTVCIVEAMKVFNEIKAKETGTLVAIQKNRGDLVSTNDILFILKK